MIDGPGSEGGGRGSGTGAHPPDAAGKDASLGGYLQTHGRPPAFEGPDGHPYTVSLEVEKGPNLETPFSGYLVFPRWADTGAGIIGHVESPLLVHARSREAAEGMLGALTLAEVRDVLLLAVRRREHETE
jgi:hypothetical protein